MSGVYIHQKLYRQQVDDGIRHTHTAQQNAEKVEHTGKEHCQVRRHRFGVDDSRYRIRGVMKAVDELKCENKG